MSRTIVVGVDGSEGSDRALEWCAVNAPKLGAEVVAVHAFHAPYAYPALDVPSMPVEVDKWKKEAQRLLETEWTAALGDVPHRTMFVDGSPGRAVVEVSDELGADLIVVGSRGRGGVAELVLGSVSHHLAHHARRPVLIVPPPN